jgi:hypothetical protein
VDFESLASTVFSFDAAIQWVALEEAGHEPRWARRTTACTPELVDPLLLMLAEGREDLYGEEAGRVPHRLLFVVLAYADFVQIVARFGADTRVSVAVAPGADAYVLGTRVAGLLDRCR